VRVVVANVAITGIREVGKELEANGWDFVLDVVTHPSALEWIKDAILHCRVSGVNEEALDSATVMKMRAAGFLLVVGMGEVLFKNLKEWDGFADRKGLRGCIFLFLLFEMDGSIIWHIQLGYERI
jgi:hypothetical protein